MSTAADYVGRTIDVLAYAGAELGKEVQLQQTLALPGESGQITTGIQKLAQRFLIELLTEQGSMPYLPNRGTAFLTEARSGRFRTQTDVFSAFSRAVLDAGRNLQREESADDPDDERYLAARALSILIESDRVTLFVELFSQANTDRKVILPINVAL